MFNKPAPFGRVLTAMVTPFSSDLKVDYDRAAELAVRLADSGSDGIVVSGSTGESPTLSSEEKLQLFKVVLDAVGSRVKVIAGTGSYNTAESVRLTRESEAVGVHGALLVVPYYNKPPQEGLYQHFSMIANSTGLPCILYNIPSRSVINMLADTVVRLSEIKNIVAIKESSGSLDQVSEIVARTDKNFALYSGDDSLTLPILSVGGNGIISVASHVVGNRIKDMIDAFFNGDVARACQEHLNLMPVFKGLFVTANPIPVKVALKLIGFPVGGLRPPLLEATSKEEESVRNTLKTIGLL